MAIAFLASKYSFGGGEHVMRLLIESLAARGYRIKVITWEHDWLGGHLNSSVELILLKNSPIGFLGKFKAIRELASILSGDSIKSLTVFSLYLAEVAALANLGSKIKMVVSERVDPRFLPKERFHRLFRWLVYLLSDRVVFQTDNNRYYYPNFISKKGVVVPNPVLKPDFRTDRGRKNRVISVGRLSEEKNFPLLINAFRQASLDRYTLHIYGKGPQEVFLKSLIKKNGLVDKVFIEGHVDNLGSVYSDADIFVLSSSHEGIPNALIEAMSYSIACVATDVPSGGVRAVMTNGHDGLIVPVGDLEQLSLAIASIANNRCLNEFLRKNAGSVCEKYSIEKITEHWLDVVN